MEVLEGGGESTIVSNVEFRVPMRDSKARFSRRHSTFDIRHCSIPLLLFFLPFIPLQQRDLSFGQPAAPSGSSFKLDTGATLVWDSDARGRTSEFIVRIAEFEPDRHFEWESRAQQGTIRIPAQVLKESKKITFARLFDNGVDIERADFLTLWLSERIYQELKQAGRSKIIVDALQDEFVVMETVPYSLMLDRRPTAVSAIKVKDGRGATWLFLDSAENPVMLEYQTQYYVQKIRYMTTKGNILRWIRQ